MAVKIKGREGVAFTFRERCDEHFHCGIYTMVGDDHRWHIDMHDVTPLNDDEYCGGCGQIGCGHG
jgi:hypothetical protein